MHPEDLAKSARELEKVFRKQKSFYECECRMQHKNGSWIWVLDRGAVMEWDAEGKPLRMSGTHQDITEMKLASEALRVEKDRLERIFESSATAILLCNKEGMIINANERSEAILGATVAELIGKKFNDPQWQIKGLDGKPIADESLPFQQAYRTKQAVFDFKVVIHGGKILSANASPVLDLNGEVDEVIITVADMTEQHRMQIDLQTGNSVYWEIMGLEEHGTKEQWLKCIHVDDLPYVKDTFQRCLEGEIDTFEAEYRYCNPQTNEDLFIRTSGQVVRRDEQGKALQIIGVTIDETERKQREKELQIALDNEQKLKERLEQQLRMIDLSVEAAKLGLWQWQPKIDSTVANDQYWEIMGLPRTKVKETWKKHIHPEDAERVLTSFEAHFNGSQPRYIAEYRYRHPQSHLERIIKTTGLVVRRDVNGKPELMIGVATDLTDLRSQERALQEALHFSERITQSSSQGIFVFDLNSNQNIYCNETYAAVMGYSCKEFNTAISKGLFSVFHPEDLQTLAKRMLDLRQKGKSHRSEVRIKGKDGHYHWFQIEQTPFEINEQGETTKLLGLIQNIDDRKQMELDLIESKRKAEAANVYKNSFISNMSHEIRTPMNGVVACSQLLDDESLTAEERHQFIQIIQNSSRQLLRLIDDILDIARMEAGELSIQYEHFQVRDFVEDVFQSFQAVLNSHQQKTLGFELHAELPTLEVEMYSDGVRLQQVLMNLLGNAMKYSHQGKIELHCALKDGQVHCSVHDQGIGIPQEHFQSIFERFNQVEYRSRVKYGGQGLGLAICKGILEQLGGTISVESEVNKGSIFRISLPLTPAFHQQALDTEKHPRAQSYHAALAGKTVLLVDDEPAILQYLLKALEPSGAQLLCASNGEEALEIYRNTPRIDAVLMDIRMPLMDGIMATRELMKIDPNALVIIQSAFVMPEERDRSFAAGCKAYLTKPLDKDVLIHTLEQVF